MSKVSSIVRSQMRKNGIMLIGMNSPKVNSLTEPLMQDLIDTFTTAKEDPDVRGVILTSDVPGVFSAGLDIVHLNGLMQEDNRAAIQKYLFEYFLGTIYGIITLPKPVVAAVNGHAIAGGLVMALAADRAVLLNSESAPRGYKLGLTELAVGVPFPQFVHDLICKQLPARTARSLMYSALNVTSKAAHTEWGIGDEEAHDPVQAAEEWLVNLTDASRPQGAFANSKRMWWRDIVRSVDPQKGADVTDQEWVTLAMQDEIKATLQKMAMTLQAQTHKQ